MFKQGGLGWRRSEGKEGAWALLLFLTLPFALHLHAD